MREQAIHQSIVESGCRQLCHSIRKLPTQFKLLEQVDAQKNPWDHSDIHAHRFLS